MDVNNERRLALNNCNVLVLASGRFLGMNGKNRDDGMIVTVPLNILRAATDEMEF